MKDKVLISVAPVSASDTLIDPVKIAEDVIRCHEQGAAMVHLHVRDRNGRLTPDVSVLKETVERIRRECDIVIQASTGGVSDLTIQERCMPLYEPWVEATSLNVGSVNLGEAVYINLPKDVRFCVEQLIRNRKIPEVEVFEIGMIKTVADLAMEYDFIKPILFSIVLGHIGAAPATEGTLKALVGSLYEFFPKGDVLWGITHANRRDFEIIGKAIELGARTVRIGFEDSCYLNPQTTVAENVVLVTETVKLLKEKGKEPMSPAEARRLLGIV